MSVRIYSRFDRPDTVESPIGNGERSIFEERIIDGERNLVVSGKEDFKSFIEASKEETLIDNIIKRFQAGDTSALVRTQGFYADVTNMPNNLAEAQNMLINLENNFNSLPVDIKEQYDNSFDKFVSKVSNMDVDQFVDAFNLGKKEIESQDIIDKVGDNVE